MAFTITFPYIMEPWIDPTHKRTLPSPIAYKGDHVNREWNQESKIHDCGKVSHRSLVGFLRGGAYSDFRWETRRKRARGEKKLCKLYAAVETMKSQYEARQESPWAHTSFWNKSPHHPPPHPPALPLTLPPLPHTHPGRRSATPTRRSYP